MGLTGTLLQISKQKCPHCEKLYGLHSKKGSMKCLYTANMNLYGMVQRFEALKQQQETFDKITVDDKGDVTIDGKDAGKLKENKSLKEDSDNKDHDK